jgi:hypothetical protein
MVRSAKTHDSASALAYFARMNGQLLKFSGSGAETGTPVTEFLECNETRLSRPLGAAWVLAQTSALYRG